jgi:LacI family transcriptional regulator
MPEKKVTIKDIARVAGVSVATVHRAMHGKAGVSGELVSKIRNIAAELGYRANFMASTLKRRNLRLAVVLPEPTAYYYINLWSGVKRLLREVIEFSIDTLEFHYPLAFGANGAALKDIYEKHLENLDGLVTIAVDHPQSSYFLEKIHDSGVPITLIGSDLHKKSRLCCVKTYDEKVGSLAAELLFSFYGGARPFSEKIILTGTAMGSGDNELLDRYYNITGFHKFAEGHMPDAKLFSIYSEDMQEFSIKLKAMLVANPDTYAVYACASRHTVHACRVAEELDLAGKLKIIGNDLFPESVQYLRRETMTAIIDKKVAQQSYLAMRALFNRVVKNEYPASSLIYVRPEVIMRSNMEDLEM